MNLFVSKKRVLIAFLFTVLFSSFLFLSGCDNTSDGSETITNNYLKIGDETWELTQLIFEHFEEGTGVLLTTEGSFPVSDNGTVLIAEFQYTGPVDEEIEVPGPS